MLFLEASHGEHRQQQSKSAVSRVAVGVADRAVVPAGTAAVLEEVHGQFHLDELLPPIHFFLEKLFLGSECLCIEACGTQHATIRAHRSIRLSCPPWMTAAQGSAGRSVMGAHLPPGKSNPVPAARWMTGGK